MSATNQFETDVLKLIFTNTTLANIGDGTGLVGSTANGSFYISLHTSDPGETGSQTTNEVAYTAYARVAVARTPAGFTVSANVVSNASQVTFPTCAGSTATATHFGIGTASTSTGNLIFKGALTSSLAISNNITPAFAAGQLTTSAD